MSKILLEELKLNNNNSNSKVVVVNNMEVEVKTYLPLKEKIQLIEETLDKSLSSGEIYCNPILLKIAFELNMIAYYSNIEIGDLDEIDMMEVYDLLKTNEVIDKVLDAIPDGEYFSLNESLSECQNAVELENSSVINLIKSGIDRLTDIIVDSTEKLKGVDLNLESENLQNVLAIARDNGAI